ncbi:MAG: sigma-70 family RNA polymerase sigma factor [Alphaproteobacteria bacterium]|nr:sigma-70 family RNA polymerase sigma factor [Alphaproteobacteria bacterium]
MPESPTTIPAPTRDALADLVEAIARDGDREAFAELFRYFAPRVKAYLLRLGAGHAQADEITQDVMVTVWRKAERFDRRLASVSTWLFTIARNRRIDVIRRTRRPEFDPDDPLFVPDPEPQPDDALLAAEREARLREAMKTLPREQAELLHEAFFKGLSHSEIAHATGIPLGTVKSRLRLAFGRLRAALEEEV